MSNHKKMKKGKPKLTTNKLLLKKGLQKMKNNQCNQRKIMKKQIKRVTQRTIMLLIWTKKSNYQNFWTKMTNNKKKTKKKLIY